ncbi:Mitochondrial presequence protease [Nowakowskiella sp. JEL0407]|nr:Mitochondrial presequence protease [Nowakowskiella sp. JEL0407]
MLKSKILPRFSERSLKFRHSLAGYATTTSVADQHLFTPGAVIHGFKVEQLKNVKEFDLSVAKLSHLKTGADYIHIFKEDSNNVLSVGFKTPPQDSTGVPHILEHTTLCGSQKYPVRDPFFKMLNRSMSTFMNAMTGSDMTMYPFSTENPKDFYNLMNVYLDATFAPRLRALDFKQEGWRLEHADAKDPTTPLVFKGVVYNEMKGALSDPSNLFLTRLLQQLYPNTTYSHVSGGDPQAITDLTHEQLVDFHKRHYHPGNAMIFTYGSFPLEEHLKRIGEKIDGVKIETPNPIGEIKSWSGRRVVYAEGPPDPMGDPEKQTKMSVTYLANDETDMFESFAMKVLVTLLTDGAAAPMYKALIESNLGTDYSPSTGYDNTARISNVSFGLQGIRENEVELVENKIKEVLKDAATTGFDESRIESVIHSIDLSIRHRRVNFGLGLSMNLFRTWTHGGDVLEAVEVTKYIDRLRKELAVPGNRFFQERIERHFVNNNNYLVFVMNPSDGYSQSLVDNEEKRLQKLISNLTEKDKSSIAADGVTLAKLQESKEDLSCLPTLTVSDIQASGKSFPVEHFEFGASATAQSSLAPIQYRTSQTNGVSYITLTRSLEDLPASLREFAGLYTTALGSLDTKRRSLADLDEYTRLISGGIFFSTGVPTSPYQLSPVLSSITKPTPLEFSVSTNAISTPLNDPIRLSKVYELISEILKETKFESIERLKTAVLGAASGAMNSVPQSGHRFAETAAAARVGFAREDAVAREMLGGLSNVKFLNDLVEGGDEAIERALVSLKEINDIVLKSPSVEDYAKSAVVSSEDVKSIHIAEIEKIFTSLNWKTDNKSNGFKPLFENAKFMDAISPSPVFYPMPFAVNYSSRVFHGVPYAHEDSAKLLLLSRLLTTNLLHRELREKGGAYGGSARYSAQTGLLSMFTYRDPPSRILQTLEVYENAIDWASRITEQVGQRELDEAKLAIFSAVDAPVDVNSEGMALYQNGITDDMFQTYRKRILNTTLEDVQAVARKYLVNAASSIAVLGDKDETGKILENQTSTKWDIELLQN